MEKKLLNIIENAKSALSAVFSDSLYRVLAVSLGLNFLALDYLLLSQATTFRVLFAQNTDFYNWSFVILSLATAVLFSLSLTMLVYSFKKQKEHTKESAPTTFFGTLFGAIASGCPVCGAWLLPILGIAGSLSAFPLQGLEIKIMAIMLLLFAIYQSSNVVLGICKPSDSKNKINIAIVLVAVFVVLLFLLPGVPQKYKVKFQKTGVSTPVVVNENIDAITESLYDQINPKNGFALDVNYGNIGYQMVQDGAIDFDKFKAIYDRAGSPLTEEQLKIFTKRGLNEKIVINRENSYFLLNLFWAFGLANENPILTEGEITKYGADKVGNFASTGGWTIAKKPLREFMAKSQLAVLTTRQQELLQRVAENVYRPCCGNSTAFPDCNHGMALLGVLELMASNGATEAELYEASKYFSAFWFPNQMLDVATYFVLTEGKEFKDVDAKIVVSEQFFSGRGWSGLKGWLEKNSKNTAGTQQVAPQGGGCGVESGAPANRQQQVVPQGGGGCGVESRTSAPAQTQQRQQIAPQGGGGCGV